MSMMLLALLSKYDMYARLANSPGFYLTQLFWLYFQVTDDAFPAKSDEADVSIRIRADRSAPLFIRSCINATISEVNFLLLTMAWE